MTATAPNAQAKGLDADKVRTLITKRLRGDPPYEGGMSARHFCLVACRTEDGRVVDPSNLSAFRKGKRGLSAESIARVAAGLGVRPSDLYHDDVDAA